MIRVIIKSNFFGTDQIMTEKECSKLIKNILLAYKKQISKESFLNVEFIKIYLIPCQKEPAFISKKFQQLLNLTMRKEKAT